MDKNWSHERKYFGLIIDGGFLLESSRDRNKRPKRGAGLVVLIYYSPSPFLQFSHSLREGERGKRGRVVFKNDLFKCNIIYIFKYNLRLFKKN